MVTDMRKILFILCLCLLLVGCSAEKPTPTTESATVPVTTAAPETEAPTTAPTTVPTEPPVVLHSGLREDGSFDSGTWFIGDSMTCILITDYLMPNNLIGEANYTGKYGTQITAFADTKMEYKSYNPCVFNPEFENMTYNDVGRQLGEQVTAIYLMWGTNFTWNAYADMYIGLVDYLLSICPNATVHLQLIPWGAPRVIEFETVNGWIQEAYEHYQQLGEPRVMLIDTYTAVERNTDSGGIHLNYEGNDRWYKAIVAHAEEHNLAQ